MNCIGSSHGSWRLEELQQWVRTWEQRTKRCWTTHSRWVEHWIIAGIAMVQFSLLMCTCNCLIVSVYWQSYSSYMPSPESDEPDGQVGLYDEGGIRVQWQTGDIVAFCCRAASFGDQYAMLFAQQKHKIVGCLVVSCLWPKNTFSCTLRKKVMLRQLSLCTWPADGAALGVQSLAQPEAKSSSV